MESDGINRREGKGKEIYTKKTGKVEWYNQARNSKFNTNT